MMNKPQQECNVEVVYWTTPHHSHHHSCDAESQRDNWHRRVYRVAIGDTVLAEFEIARRTLPNESQIFELTGYIARRRGKHEEGLRNLERALELDPRNFTILQQIALSHTGSSTATPRRSLVWTALLRSIQMMRIRILRAPWRSWIATLTFAPCLEQLIRSAPKSRQRPYHRG
jgi:tetratricopeptide (TPR) repeat protein